MMQKLVAHVVKQLVEKPEAVQVKEVQDGPKLIIEIFVDSHDLKRVIGKEGRIVRSLRSMINCFDPIDKELILDVAQ